MTIAQFYDLPLCYFTFSGFQLAHTLEELKTIMGRNLKDHNPFPKLDEVVTPKIITLALGMDVQVVIANWDTKGVLKGLSRKFLES